MLPAVAACLLALAATTAAQPSPVIDEIDWPSFLSRHDPVWSFDGASSHGYTVLPGTIKTGGGASCAAPTCASAATCVEESAAACDACATCASFALCPVWHNGTQAQFYGGDAVAAPNAPWTTWAKGGPVLANHCSFYPKTLRPRAAQRP